MKTIAIALIASFLFTLSGYGQLDTRHNHYRTGDMLIKQQVEFADPRQPVRTDSGTLVK